MNHPIANKLLCAGFVAAFMLPLGEMVYPYVADLMGSFQFGALEAVVGATLGLAVDAVIFG